MSTTRGPGPNERAAQAFLERNLQPPVPPVNHRPNPVARTGGLPAEYRTYSEWWIAERVACSSCGQQLTTRWKQRRLRIDKRLHHLRMIGACVRHGKYRGALWHARRVAT